MVLTATRPEPLIEGPGRSRRKSRRTPRLTPYMFILPFFLVYGLFMLYPVLSALQLSAYEKSGFNEAEFVGLQNFQDLLRDGRFRRALANTAVYAVGCVCILSPLALLLAVAIRSYVVPWPRLRSFYRIGFFLPNITSLVVVSIIFGGLLDSGTGPLNEALRGIGFSPISFLTSSSTVLPTIIAVAIWAYTGLNALYFLSGLQGIPEEFYEAAALDGAGRVKTFFTITLPLIRPTIVFVVVQAIIFSFQIFELPYLLSAGGPGDASLTLGIYLYHVGFTDFNQGYASALGYAIALITLGLAGLQLLLFRLIGRTD
jgi:ABC-type sugar transport system permease subunit